jgi:hypothetical protein
VLLEEWHRKEGPVPPPCARLTLKPSSFSKTYDRRGREVKVTTFKVSRPCAYGVLVVAFQDNSCKLVSSIFKGNRRFGVFYKTWLGANRGYEPEGCVVRHFGDTLDKVRYQEEAWKYLEDELKSQQDGAGQATVSGQRKRTATLGSMNNEHNKRRRSRNTPDISSDEEIMSSSEEDENEVKAEKTPLTGIRKGGNGTPQSRPCKHQVIFKLVGFNINAGGDCELPLEDCSSNAQLFTIAQSFYRVFDRNVKVQTLSCQITSQEERRYLFANAEGAFQLLVERAKRVAKDTRRPATIEVQFVQS